MKNLISIEDLTFDQIKYIITYTKKLENDNDKNELNLSMNNKILGCLFYEPSTRTRCSFESAMYKLGGNVININSSSSSVKKGESLEDTIKTLGIYCDGIILRHPKENLSQCTNICNIPIINAGDGIGEHPTQALLDLYTINEELNLLSYQKINIVLVGDLKNSRTIHSLVKVLCFYKKVEFIFVSPDQLKMPNNIIKYIIKNNIKYYNLSLEEAIKISDVLYVTRIQKERFDTEELYEQVKDSYIINKKKMLLAKKKMIIMHPFPRNNELSTDLDDDSRSAYFKQMKNGVHVRMSILNMLINKDYK